MRTILATPSTALRSVASRLSGGRDLTPGCICSDGSQGKRAPGARTTPLAPRSSRHTILRSAAG